MLEIILIIWVVKRFRALAMEKHLNGTLWAWIGALSYYVPILLMSFFILPGMVGAGLVNFNGMSEMEMKFVFILINVVTGVLCCMIAFQTLKSKPDGENGYQPDVLDDSF